MKQRPAATMLFNYTLLMIILVLSSLLIGSAYAATSTERTGAGATGSGETVYWIALSIVLTLILSRKLITSLLSNPLAVLAFIAIIVFSYILWKAIEIVTGVDTAIDGAISNTADSINNLLR